MTPSYVSRQGKVLAIRYPVPPRTGSSGDLPAMQIEPAPAQSAASDYVAYIVYEPYEAQGSRPLERWVSGSQG